MTRECVKSLKRKIKEHEGSIKRKDEAIVNAYRAFVIGGSPYCIKEATRLLFQQCNPAQTKDLVLNEGVAELRTEQVADLRANAKEFESVIENNHKCHDSTERKVQDQARVIEKATALIRRLTSATNFDLGVAVQEGRIFLESKEVYENN